MRKKLILTIIIILIILVIVSIYLFVTFRLEIVFCKITEIDEDNIHGSISNNTVYTFDMERVSVTNSNGEIILKNELNIGDIVQVQDNKEKYKGEILEINNNDIVLEVFGDRYYSFTANKALVLNKYGIKVSNEKLKEGDYVCVINMKEIIDTSLTGDYTQENSSLLKYLDNVIFIKIIK